MMPFGNRVNIDNTTPHTGTASGNDVQNQHSAGHQTHAEDTEHVVQGVAGDQYADYGKLPYHMRCDIDRGNTRSDAELAAVFKFKHDDNTSVAVPSVLKRVCGYRIGIEAVRQQFENVKNPSHVSMDTDASETVPHELFDDHASDGECVMRGMKSHEYQERMKQVIGIVLEEKKYSWLGIYEQFIGECCEVERNIVAKVQELRLHPDRDVGYFCRHNLKSHTKQMAQRWQMLNAVEQKIRQEMKTLQRSSNPCVVTYSDIELHFWSENYLQQLKITGNTPIPEEWKQLYEKKLFRQTIASVDCSCKNLVETIETCISKMDDQRKEKYIKLHSRFTGLEAIVRKLDDIISGRQVLDVVFTEEEMWYNEFDYSYVDMYNTNDEANATVAPRSPWENTTKETRHDLSTKVMKHCCSLHQRYGELVKTLRTRRESLQCGIKTHVSELDRKVVQLQSQIDDINKEFDDIELRWNEKDIRTQQANADLTNQLEKAHQSVDQAKTHVSSQWQIHCQQLTTEHKRQQEHLQTNVAEMRKKMVDLKIEKENLLTRLSKIAGSKLVQGNPAITDLSDPNRPTKISERYSELYDNEWTDALEELADTEGIVQGGEVVCTKTLLAILIEAFTFCCDTEAKYTKTITQSLTSLPGPDPDSTEQEQKNATTLTEEQTQQLDDLRKTCVPLLTTAVESKFLTLMEKRFEHLFKQAGGQIRSGRKVSHSGEERQIQEDESMTTYPTDDVAASEDNDGDHKNVLCDVDQSNPTPKQEAVVAGLPSDKDATPKHGAICPDQQPSGQVDDRSHRRFDLGCSNDQGNPQKDTGQQSNTTDTICHAKISALAKTSRFAKTCVNICWFMRIQNPPMHMDRELVESSDINVDFYKNYTQKGKKVGYLVWPAIFLHKGGPLLCKGIVQPLSEKKG